MRLRPDDYVTLNNLAWILATAEDETLADAVEAVRLAERACELSGYEVAGALDTLAVAYAAAGRFDDAVRIADQALALVKPRSRLAAAIRERRALYRSGSPYVEPPD